MRHNLMALLAISSIIFTLPIHAPQANDRELKAGGFLTGTPADIIEQFEHDDGEVVFRHACQMGSRALFRSVKTLSRNGRGFGTDSDCGQTEGTFSPGRHTSRNPLSRSCSNRQRVRRRQRLRSRRCRMNS